MRDGVRTGLGGDLHQSLGDQRTRNRCAEQVDSFVERVGAEHGKHEVGDEFLAHILDIDFLDAQHLGLASCRLKLLSLPQVCSEGNHLRTKFGLQPLQYY